MVSWKAKNGFNCVSCGTHRGGRACGMSFAKTRTQPERFDAQKGGGLGNPAGECFLRIIFCYEGSARAMPGAAKGSLRNVRHEQPIRHRSWKCFSTAVSPLGIEIASASPSAVTGKYLAVWEKIGKDWKA
jgi:hypothetical protein